MRGVDSDNWQYVCNMMLLFAGCKEPSVTICNRDTPVWVGFANGDTINAIFAPRTTTFYTNPSIMILLHVTKIASFSDKQIGIPIVRCQNNIGIDRCRGTYAEGGEVAIHQMLVKILRYFNHSKLTINVKFKIFTAVWLHSSWHWLPIS